MTEYSSCGTVQLQPREDAPNMKPWQYNLAPDALLECLTPQLNHADRLHATKLATPTDVTEL